MDRKILAALLALCLLLCSGCGQNRYPELPEDGIAFEMGSFEDTEHDSDLFGTLEYNGRIYIMYGATGNSYDAGKVDTRGKDIRIPEFVEDLGYEFWK